MKLQTLLNSVLVKKDARRTTPVPAYAARGLMVTGEQQAVIVHLGNGGKGLTIYDQFHESQLEEQLVETLERSGAGEYDGSEVSVYSNELVLFMYGPDAELLFQTVQPTLLRHRFCKGAKVVIRRGDDGASERNVKL